MANPRYNYQVTNSRACMSKGGSTKKFPDLTGDGKVTRADVLKGRGVFKKGGSTSKYHKTKSGKMARKGLWYNIMMKKKRGEKMRKKGEKGAPTAAAIKKSQGK
jgi:hypothetical protein